IYTEKNSRYIETDWLDNFTFQEDGKSFIILSEQNGYKHLYQYDLSGVRLKQLTEGNYDVIRYYGYDAARKFFYYQAAEKSPMQREVWAVSADKKKKIRLSELEGTNNASFSNGFKYYINTFNNVKTPNLVTLHDISGKEIRVLEDNAELQTKLSALSLPQKEFFHFKTSEGVELNGWMIKPRPFRADTKYPVLMTQYSGPNSQQVLDIFSVSWDTYLAQQGYLVVCVDPRGTGARGEEFRKCTYGKLGDLESTDQVETAKYLGGLPFVDSGRIAIWGWSFGGFISAMTLCKGGDLIHAAIAVAPVISHYYYDTVYTERYMGMPSQNQEGYDQNSPIALAKGIKGKLLLVAGTADDNVHYQNTIEFAEALVQNNIQFRMMTYNNRNHNLRGGNTTLHLYTLFDEFLKENLK
ncbi:MAG: prolyl oligopeptidase family serine peptidase, partial [Marinilabiliales bacterium]|nr:prolyl oligopeptidase family serine peptidase [Marinilabiliales bacterium]